MKNLSYEVKGKNLIIQKEVRFEVQFEHKIAEVVRVNGVLVVILEVPAEAILNENVFGVSETGRVIWQIAARDHVYEDSPYTGLQIVGDKIKLFNWDGLELLVDPRSGKILSESYGK